MRVLVGVAKSNFLKETMAFNKDQFRSIIRGVLYYLEPEIPYSRSAEELLMLTCATESLFGTYLKQVIGPATGVFQMEPETWEDIQMHFLRYNEPLQMKVEKFYADDMPYMINAVGNLPFQIVQARVFYRRIKAPLPQIKYLPMADKAGEQVLSPEYIKEIAEYWKKYYNTHLGKGTVAKAIQNYERYVFNVQ